MELVFDVLDFISELLDRGSHSTKSVTDTARVVYSDYKHLKSELENIKAKNLVQKTDIEN